MISGKKIVTSGVGRVGYIQGPPKFCWKSRHFSLQKRRQPCSSRSSGPSALCTGHVLGGSVSQLPFGLGDVAAVRAADRFFAGCRPGISQCQGPAMWQMQRLQFSKSRGWIKKLKKSRSLIADGSPILSVSPRSNQFYQVVYVEKQSNGHFTTSGSHEILLGRQSEALVGLENAWSMCGYITICRYVWIHLVHYIYIYIYIVYVVCTCLHKSCASYIIYIYIYIILYYIILYYIIYIYYMCMLMCI